MKLLSSTPIRTNSAVSIADACSRHYQDAYDVLTVMFGSVAILPPRTKRWAEAKVLADCIDVKVDMYCIGHSQANTFIDSQVILVQQRTRIGSLSSYDSCQEIRRSVERLGYW